jgi:nitroreductase
MGPLDKDAIEPVKSFASSLKVPFADDTEIRFFRADPTNKLYMTMRSPENNMAFLAETDIVSISKAGFVGELVILYAGSRGLSTCWYGHYRLSELERLMPHLQSAEQLLEANMGYGYAKGVVPGRRAICITPLGYHEGGGLRLMDRITEKTVSFKRKETYELLEDTEDCKHLSGHMLYALDLGRKAPSAANAQMWRFSFGDDFKTVYIAMPEGYRHFKWEHPNVDIGICACHVWLGLVDRGFAPAVSVYEDRGRAVWKLSVCPHIGKPCDLSLTFAPRALT